MTIEEIWKKEKANAFGVLRSIKQELEAYGYRVSEPYEWEPGRSALLVIGRDESFDDLHEHDIDIFFDISINSHTGMLEAYIDLVEISGNDLWSFEGLKDVEVDPDDRNEMNRFFFWLSSGIVASRVADIVSERGRIRRTAKDWRPRYRGR